MEMTYDQQIVYYANLLIMQYRNKPVANATVEAVAREAMIDNLPLQVRDAFDLASAAGKQLDLIGKYAGVNRNVLTFSTGMVLSDSDYRTMLRMVMVQNYGKSSLKDIDDLILKYMGTALVAFDNANMTMSYFFNASFGSVALAEAFIKLGLLPKPMGVQLSSLIYAGNLTNPYGWGSYAAGPFQVHGFNTYALHDDTGNPWISYTNAISL